MRRDRQRKTILVPLLCIVVTCDVQRYVMVVGGSYSQYAGEFILEDARRVNARADAILESAALTLQKLQPYLPVERRGLGCFICVILRALPNVAVLHAIVGTVHAEKAQRYSTLSAEKAGRTLSNPDHYLSWESRNEAFGHYQGAAASRVRSIGVSGLPSEADEVIAIDALVDVRDLTRTEADYVALISNNSLYRLVHPASS